MKTRATLALAVASMLTMTTAQACPNDRLLGADKAQHFATSAALAALGTAATRSEVLGFSLSLGLGVLKEVYDSRHPERHCASIKDIAADAAGAYVGAKGAGWVLFPQRGGFVFLLKKEF